MTDKPAIEPIVNGPFLVKNLKDFRNSRGDTIETKLVMALCRCGASKTNRFVTEHIGISILRMIRTKILNYYTLY